MSDRFRLTDSDCAALAFAAEHRLVLERQIQRLLGRDGEQVRRQLEVLAAGRYLRQGCVFGDPHVQIRPLGLAAIDSNLPAPRDKLGSYKHDVGLAWLWIGAREGAFGPLDDAVSERRMRSEDGASDDRAEPYGVRLGGPDRYGHERLHYPDLLLIDPGGRRLALELELTGKSSKRRELILGGYGADRRIDRVLYLVENGRTGRPIQRALEATARSMGLSDRVQVQLITPIRLSTDTGAAFDTARRVARAREAPEASL